MVETSFSSAQQQLSESAYIGNIEQMREAIAAGANINLQDQAGHQPLIRAAISGNIAAAIFLLKEGAKADAENRYGVTPLMAASGSGHKELANLFLSLGANPRKEDKDYQYNSAQHASGYGHGELAQQLFRIIHNEAPLPTLEEALKAIDLKNLIASTGLQSADPSVVGEQILEGQRALH